MRLKRQGRYDSVSSADSSVYGGGPTIVDLVREESHSHYQVFCGGIRKTGAKFKRSVHHRDRQLGAAAGDEDSRAAHSGSTGDTNVPIRFTAVREVENGMKLVELDAFSREKQSASLILEYVAM